jgi:hypothetical protein
MVYRPPGGPPPPSDDTDTIRQQLTIALSEIVSLQGQLRAASQRSIGLLALHADLRTGAEMLFEAFAAARGGLPWCHVCSQIKSPSARLGVLTVLATCRTSAGRGDARPWGNWCDRHAPEQARDYEYTSALRALVARFASSPGDLAGEETERVLTPAEVEAV